MKLMCLAQYANKECSSTGYWKKSLHASALLRNFAHACNVFACLTKSQVVFRLNEHTHTRAILMNQPDIKHVRWVLLEPIAFSGIMHINAKHCERTQRNIWCQKHCYHVSNTAHDCSALLPCRNVSGYQSNRILYCIALVFNYAVSKRNHTTIDI